MEFIAEISIMPKKELLDPQGKAVLLGLHNLGYAGVSDVRVGKNIHIRLSAESEEVAKQQVEESCKKLLANQIMESYSFRIVAA